MIDFLELMKEQFEIAQEEKQSLLLGDKGAWLGEEQLPVKETWLDMRIDRLLIDVSKAEQLVKEHEFEDNIMRFKHYDEELKPLVKSKLAEEAYINGTRMNDLTEEEIAIARKLKNAEYKMLWTVVSAEHPLINMENKEGIEEALEEELAKLESLSTQYTDQFHRVHELYRLDKLYDDIKRYENDESAV